MDQHPGTQTSVPAATTTRPRLADLVIRAGAIYSMASDHAMYRAVALRDEWIVAVSSDPHGLDDLISSSTRVLDDLASRSYLPCTTPTITCWKPHATLRWCRWIRHTALPNSST